MAHSVDVALPGGRLAAGSVMAVAVHSVDSSAVVVAASEYLAYASGTAAVASDIEGAAFALTAAAGSSAVA